MQAPDILNISFSHSALSLKTDQYFLFGPGDPGILSAAYGTVYATKLLEPLGIYSLVTQNVQSEYGLELLPPNDSHNFSAFVLALEHLDPQGSHTVCACFNAPLDSTTASIADNFDVLGRTVVAAEHGGCGNWPYDQNVLVTIEEPFLKCPEGIGNFYPLPCNTVTVSGVKDYTRARTIHTNRNIAHFDNTTGAGVRKVTVTASNTLRVDFWNPVLDVDDQNEKWEFSAANPANYSLINSQAIVTEAAVCMDTPTCVDLTWSNTVSSGLLIVSDVEIADLGEGSELAGSLINTSAYPTPFGSGPSLFRVADVNWGDPTVQAGKDNIEVVFNQAVTDDGTATNPCNYASTTLAAAGVELSSAGYFLTETNAVTITFDTPIPDSVRTFDLTVGPESGCNTITAASNGASLYTGPSNLIVVEFSNAIDNWPREKGSAVDTANYVLTGHPEMEAVALYDPLPNRVLLRIGPKYKYSTLSRSNILHGWSTYSHDTHPPLPSGTFPLTVKNVWDQTKTVFVSDTTVNVSVP